MRALTEKYYGRVARLFVLRSDESMPDELRGGGLAALMLRQAADELIARATRRPLGDVHIRLDPSSDRAASSDG